MQIKSLNLLLLFTLLSFVARGQSVIQESLFTDDYTINPENAGVLGLSIDNISFLKNNESDGDVVKGYTAPGFRLNPRLVFYPSPIIKLEAGLSLLRYWGADKYPNYAYSDIAEWKADHYQWGFHLLPFFRAQIQPIPQLNIILGNLYGGDNHGLIDPMYHRDLNFTADPELGAQVLYNSRVAHVDAWVNWESFTFNNETHNEAVTVGGAVDFHITDPKSFFYLGVPVQAMFIHRGGELDTIVGDILSMANGAAGLRFGFNFDNPYFKSVGLDVMGLGFKAFAYKEESLFFSEGWAFYSRLYAQIWHLNVKMGFWRSGNYMNLFGTPIFGNVSNVHDWLTFPRTMVYNPGIRYEQKFGNGFYLGADFECFYSPDLTAYSQNVRPVQTKNSFNCSMGVYLRINPSIVFKKYVLPK